MATSNTPPAGGGSEPGKGDLTPAEREAFKQRADELGKRLEAAKGHTAPLPKSGSAGDGTLLSTAMRIATELIGGMVVGAGLGWLFDRALGTWPAFFIVLFLLGSAAGIYNVVRAGTAMKTGPNNPAAGPAVRDDDDET